MKVISLNVNNFGGVTAKPLLHEYKQGNNIMWDKWSLAVDTWRQKNHNMIIDNVNSVVKLVKEYDIIFLYEVDTNCKSWEHLLKQLLVDYKFVPANGVDVSTYKKGRKSVCCGFVKKGIDFKYADYNFMRSAGFESHRNIEIKVNNINLIGVHMSYDNGKGENWLDLIKRFNSLKNEKTLIIGDLNTFDTGTTRHAMLKKLLGLGAIDVWLKQGNKNETPTAVTNKRIDYALSSNSLYDDIVKMDTLHDIRLDKHTGHSALAVEIKTASDKNKKVTKEDKKTTTTDKKVAVDKKKAVNSIRTIKSGGK